MLFLHKHQSVITPGKLDRCHNAVLQRSTGSSSAEGNSAVGSSYNAKLAKHTKTVTLAAGKLFLKSRKMAQDCYFLY
ncbi:unnamed protein product [Caenorhabditis brenneri]